MRFQFARQLFLALVATNAVSAVTVYLAGDSTMTANGNNDGTAGNDECPSVH